MAYLDLPYEQMEALREIAGVIDEITEFNPKTPQLLRFVHELAPSEILDLSRDIKKGLYSVVATYENSPRIKEDGEIGPGAFRYRTLKFKESLEVKEAKLIEGKILTGPAEVRDIKAELKSAEKRDFTKENLGAYVTRTLVLVKLAVNDIPFIDTKL